MGLSAVQKHELSKNRTAIPSFTRCPARTATPRSEGAHMATTSKSAALVESEAVEEVSVDPTAAAPKKTTTRAKAAPKTAAAKTAAKAPAKAPAKRATKAKASDDEPDAEDIDEEIGRASCRERVFAVV